MRVRLSIGHFSRMTHLSVKALRHDHTLALTVERRLPIAIQLTPKG